jgi:hypothetical protein
MNETELREIGKIYGFETDQQRSELILKKIIDQLEKETEERYDEEIDKTIDK